MSRRETTLTADYFESLYAADADPWRFATSDYERTKYAATLGALPKPIYGHGLEVGCSIGILTEQIARRCDALLSLDIAQGALDQARRRCVDLPHVAFQQARVPQDWPAAKYDLILLSEVVYYLDRNDVAALSSHVGSSLAEDADVILVHWLGLTNYPLTGDEAAELFISRSARYSRVLHQSRTDQYRLDILRAGAAR